MKHLAIIKIQNSPMYVKLIAEELKVLCLAVTVCLKTDLSSLNEWEMYLS